MSDPFAGFGAPMQAQQPVVASGGMQPRPVASSKVLFDYAAQAQNQINLRTGQIIPLLTVGAKGGWSKGIEMGTGM